MSNTVLQLTALGNDLIPQEIGGNRCPKCTRERAEGVKCGCELVPIIKIDYPNDGNGIFTYLGGYKYPFPGFADQNLVDLNAVVKRTLITSVFLVLKKPFVYVIPLLFFWRSKAIDVYVDWFAGVVDAAYKNWGANNTKYLNPLSRYSHAVREFMRTGMIFAGENVRYKQLVMGIVTALEYDNAYRFRFQDCLSEINKENLKKKPRKEIIRILKIGLERECLKEGINSVQGKWIKALKILNIGLFIYPSLTKFISNFMLELDINEIKPDANDWYYMSERWDYNFAGLSFQERLTKKNQEDKEWRLTNPEQPVPSQVTEQKPYIGLVPSETFWALDHEKALEMITKMRDNFMLEFDSRKMKTN